MKTILIRNLHEQTLENLKTLAQYHHRSLQGELHYIMEKATEKMPGTTGKSLELKTVRTRYQGTWSRDEIYGDDER